MATILVVDDETAIRAVCAAILARAGHSVYQAANGLEGVAVFRSYASNIDLVIMDMVMPAMDGKQAIERIRETRPDVPVICISGYCDLELPKDVCFLQKPFTPALLVSLIGLVLGS